MYHVLFAEILKAIELLQKAGILFAESEAKLIQASLKLEQLYMLMGNPVFDSYPPF